MKKILIAFLSLIIIAPSTYGTETLKVSGTVKDSDGQPFPGVIIYMKNDSTINTATDEQGSFTLNYEQNRGDKIVVSSMGYIPQELTPTENMDITLYVDTETLSGFAVEDLTISDINKCAQEQTLSNLNATSASFIETGNKLESGSKESICIPTTCKDGYHLVKENTVNAQCTTCTCGERWNAENETCIGLTDDEKDCEPNTDGATAGVLDCRDGVSYCRATACDTANGYVLADDTCKCTAPGFEDKGGKCTPRAVLSANNYQNEIRDLAANAQKMRDKETSDINKAIGAVGIGTVGIGGTMIGGALAERAADITAEQEMTGYLESFRCDYGSGRNITGGETNVELPGGNDMISLYTEYAQLANDLKIRKEALGIRPGIESEIVIDKAETGLYDDVGTGITGGTYASIARALLNPDGEDAAMWAAQRAATDSKLKTGAIVAGVGAVGSAVANIAINHGKGNKSKEIIARYEKLRAPLAAAAEHANTPYTPGDNSLDCSRFTGTTGVGKSPNCVCADPTNTRFNYDRSGCVPCESPKVYNQNDECVCPSATPRWNDATNRCESEPTVCLLANKLKHATKCECVENASAPDGKNCQCNTDEGFEKKDGQCVQKEVPPEHESGSEIGKFSFSADALFASSSWEIKSDKLTQLRSDLANAKQTAITEKIDLNTDDYCVVVVGKTDRTQYPKNSSMNNTKLSLNRANAIKRELKTVFKESNILTYGIAAKDCPKSKYTKANTADCRRVDVTWLAGSCEENARNATNWISNVAEATDAISELQSLLKK